MVMIRKPVIENPVYCEILFRLGTKKTYVSDLLKEWEESIELTGYDQTVKKQSVLSRQMDFLMKEGFLNVTDKNKRGKKLRSNIKLYWVNIDKIIDCFLDYFLENVVDEDALKHKKEWITDKFRSKCKSNLIIRYFFLKLIEEPNYLERDLSNLTLAELFKIIPLFIDKYYNKITEWMAFTLKEKDIFIKSNVIIDIKEDVRYTKRHLKKDYIFFREHFANAMSHKSWTSSFLIEEMPMHISNLLLNGLTKDDKKTYSHHF